jgi:hypothetical protein
MKRLRITLLGIGIALLIFSVLPATQIMSLGGTAEPQEYRTAFYTITGDIYIDINVSHNGSINFYLLNYEDAVELVKTMNLDTANPVLSIMNVTIYQNYLGLIPTGLYAFVVETAMNTTAGFDIDMIRVLPQWGIFLPGIIFLLPELGFTISKISHKVLKTPTNSLGETSE